MAAQPGRFAFARILSHLFLVPPAVFLGAGPHAASAYIRVNQVGYAGHSTKRPYLMASGGETGAAFAVKNSGGTTVYSAAVGASLGAWRTFTSVYALDFSSVSTAGTYTISVASPIAAKSPAFKIDTAANLCATPPANALYYYETSRDGPNTWGTSLLVGDGGTFALCMQHQMTNLVAVPPNGPPFLLGAVVEEPNSLAAKGTLTGMVACPRNGMDVFAQFIGSGAVFQDNLHSFSTVESAIDLSTSVFATRAVRTLLIPHDAKSRIKKREAI